MTVPMVFIFIGVFLGGSGLRIFTARDRYADGYRARAERRNETAPQFLSSGFGIFGGALIIIGLLFIAAGVTGLIR